MDGSQALPVRDLTMFCANSNVARQKNHTRK
jgi:hypothetical protein